MKKYFKIFRSSAFLVVTSLISVTAHAATEGGLPPVYLQRLNQAVQIIKNNYVEPISDETIFKNAMKGILDGLDPHSSYLDADDLRDLKSMTTGRLSGLGIEITMEDGFIKVITPLDDTPAQKAGIKSGDIIVRIDNTLTKGLSLREAAKKMRGLKGTPVTLTIVRKNINKPIKVKLVRADIKLQSVKSRLLEPNLGYLRISNFEESTSNDVENALKKLNLDNKAPLKGLILDLRNNPGGLLESAASVANKFLDPKFMSNDGLIVYTKGRVSDAQIKIKAQMSDALYRAPLIVLVNEGSASGAEIVAGALQDQKRALVIGTRSFGKGSVQTVIPLDGGTTAVKLTTALYYTPSGRSIQAAGIAPDVEVEDFKISQIQEGQLADLYAKEADLQGHLNNNQITAIKINGLMTENIPNKQMITSDYQLSVALYLLEGMTAWNVKH